jgi:lipopolysaccharide transport system ATP-binding protein
MTLLVVDEVEKGFREYSSEWKRVASWFGVQFTPLAENLVLRGISFSIGPGEAVGIVGQNGAGKSTLLKLITGTLAPSRGNIQVNGRISAILELGMGFNPELTGRQNVYHAASIMGFDSDHVNAVIKDIEAFAEIGSYFDEPVRVYSSGMQVRVAFAVATAWRPEILIVDEALSVGDSYFQHKSFGRIREFQAQGTTLLIVSHDRASIQALCDRALLFEKGRVIKDGAPEEVMDFYNALIAEKENSTVDVRRLADGKAQTSSGTGEVRVESIALYSRTGEAREHVKVGEALTLQISVGVFSPVESLVLGFAIRDRLGQVIFGSNTYHSGQVVEKPEVGRNYQFSIAFDANLGVGSYSVVTALHSGDSHLGNNYEWRDLALVFDVINANKPAFQGCNWLDTKIHYE